MEIVEIMKADRITKSHELLKQNTSLFGNLQRLIKIETQIKRLVKV